MKPIVLCILDGWGESRWTNHNAVALGRTPVFDTLRATCPTGSLSASGTDVGLPKGQMGNSEVGHMNLGAGRIIIQDLPRIDEAIASGQLSTNRELRQLIKKSRARKSRCHLVGLVSPGGVHSHQNHMTAIANYLTESGISVLVHAILDGRDTPPKSATPFLQNFFSKVGPNVRIASAIGRFFAMDRDNRWERVEAAYRLFAAGEGYRADHVFEAISKGYTRGETDEFLKATVIKDYDGFHDGDTILFTNFRSDRAREIISALVDPAFEKFVRLSKPSFSHCSGMVTYSTNLKRHMGTLFPQKDVTETIGEIVSSEKLKQLRIAETEKYAHVTFFLNGGQESPFSGEERILIPSPKVKTYDLQPEMSAIQLTSKLVKAISKNHFDFIVVNYANPDMVGHTGNLKAAIHAVETVDQSIGRLVTALNKVNGSMLLTSDHGNCEMMLDPTTGHAHTAHTTNLVPTILFNGPEGVKLSKRGRLADVAPTLLQMMGIKMPSIMTGHSLIKPAHKESSTRVGAIK